MDLPGEKLLIKLWETCAEKGVGSLLRPAQMTKEGRVAIELKAEERLALAQVELDIEKMQKGEAYYSLEDRKVVALGDSPQSLVPGAVAEWQPPNSLARDAVERAVADLLRKEVNVTRAIGYAEDALKDDAASPSEEPVNQDWLFRWRENASQVSSDELQQLWGRVLAGEVKKPGSFSLRAMDAVRNLSQSEAQLISRVAQLSFGSFIVKPSVNGAIDLAEFGLGYERLMELQSIGILSGVEAVGIRKQWHVASSAAGGSCLFVSGRKGIRVVAPAEEKTFHLPVINVTSTGKQIIGLADVEEDLDYLLMVCQSIKSQGLSVSLCNAKKIDEVRYNLEMPGRQI